MSVRTSLELLLDVTDTSYFTRVVAVIADDVLGGNAISMSFPVTVIPELEVTTARASESSVVTDEIGFTTARIV